MFVLILSIHVLVCFALMAVVLMQSGKGHGLAGAFGGGGGNQTLFGGRGAVDFLGKATWVRGGAFMVTSLTLAILSGAAGRSTKVNTLIPKETGAAPAVPGGGVPAPGSEGTMPGGAQPGGGTEAPSPAASEPSQSAPAQPAPAQPAPAPSGGGK